MKTPTRTAAAPRNSSRFGIRRATLLLAIVLVILPFAMPNDFFFDLAIRVMLNVAVVIGMNLLIGYAGQISLGHAGFFGIGAYASAILCGRYGWPSLFALIAGTAFAGAAALLIARPILRLRGHYLAMATLGLVIILNIGLITETELTDGPDGISVPPLEAFGKTVSDVHSWYVIVAVFVFVVILGTRNLVESPAGRAMQAIKGSETAARTSGVDVTRFKVRIFMASAMLTSIAGSLLAHYIGFITPDISSVSTSIEFLTMVVVGGMASIYGSVIGALFLTLLPQALSSFAEWQTVIYGVVLVIFMIFLPKGIVPSLRDWMSRKTS